MIYTWAIFLKDEINTKYSGKRIGMIMTSTRMPNNNFDMIFFALYFLTAIIRHQLSLYFHD